MTIPEYKQPRDLATAAAYLSISISCVRQLIAEGRLTAFRVGPRCGIRILVPELVHTIDRLA